MNELMLSTKILPHPLYNIGSAMASSLVSLPLTFYDNKLVILFLL